MFNLGPFSFDQENRVLYRDGQLISVSPKAVEVLAVLIERCGDAITKDELIEKVWPDQFVEEGNLTQKIYELRKVFQGNSEIVIETIPRRGYRLLVADEALVETKTDALAPAGETLPVETVTGPLAIPDRSSKGKTYTLAAIAGVAIIALAVAMIYFVRRPTRHPIRSIAVLPLKSAGATNVEDSLRLRLADSIITRLGSLGNIVVRPTSSVIGYDRSKEGAIEAGRELGVDAVADGTIDVRGNELLVKISLFSVADGSELWSQQFSGQPEKLLPLQDRIATQIVSHLNFRVTNEASLALASNVTENAEAYEAFLRGRYFLTQRSSANLVKAIAEFERAVILDPQFTLAYAGLGDAYALLSVYDERPPKLAFPQATNYARKALELDPNLAEAHVTLGFIAYRWEWNWSEAERLFARAIELKPNYATAHHWRGELLNALGRFAEGEESLRQALALDPTSSVISADLGYGLMLAGRFNDADLQLRRTIENNPEFTLGYYCLWDNQLQQQKNPEAAQTFISWMEKARFQRNEIDVIRSAAASEDPKVLATAQKNWAVSENARNYFTKFDFAKFALLNGDRDDALQWLTAAAEERSPDLIFVKVHPAFASLRNDPRFQEIIAKMNL